jgi:AcrR family transcriptional regulator
MDSMSNLSRKQREIADREGNILHVARRMLKERGYLGLSMDAIAAELEYSKGTIYNHFPCKEEIIIALAIETMNKRSEMFEKAALHSGRSRVRMCAIGVASELFVRLYPDHFEVEQLIRSSSIWDKTSESRRLKMHAGESRCMGIVGGIVREGIAQDEVTLPEGMTAEDLVFGLWSLSFGAYSIIVTTESLAGHGVHDPYLAVRQNITMLLDGFPWKPVSTEFDYLELFERLIGEVFPDEYRQIAAA